MKKILQCTIAQSKGGKTIYIIDNWKHIDKRRFGFDFITFSPYLDFAEELENDGCKIYYLSSYPENDQRTFEKEFGKILTNGYDAIHIHTGMWKGMLMEKMAKAYGIQQIIIHAHNTGMGNAISYKEEEIGRKRHYEIREKLKEGDATNFLACSRKAAEWLYGNTIPIHKIKILRNAIETEKFMFSKNIRNNIRNELNINSNYAIGHVGRFVYQKNHEFLLDVFYDISKIIPNALLVLIGDGELYCSIEKRIYDLDIKDRVLFLGKRDDVNNILQGIDLFLFPSIFEGFGTAVIEAQCSGVPCIVSDAVPEEVCVTDLVTFEPLIKEKWKKAIFSEYAVNKVRYSRHTEIREAGYDIKKQIKQLETIYSYGELYE